MENKIKSNRKNKREVVMPFDGEENFVVPKRGGFGQADNDKYVMVTGRATTIPTTITKVVETVKPLATPIATPTKVVSTTISTPVSTPAPAPTVIETPTRATAITPIVTRTAPAPTSNTLNTNTEQIGVGVGTSTSTTTTPIGGATMESTISGGVVTRPTTTTTIETAPLPELPSRIDTPTTSVSTLPDDTITPPSDGGVVIPPRGGDVVVPPPSESLPTFPDFNSLTCDALNTEILRIANVVSTTRFTSTTIANSYNNALSSAKSIYTSKCNTTGGTNVEVKTETQLPSPIGGGGIGGGGGLGEEPTADGGEVVEAPKTNYNWLIVLLLLGGGLYMLRKK